MVHSLTADLFAPIIGLHVALHWQWIVNTAMRLLFRAPRLGATAVAAPRPRQEA
jgi:hypothetical protein